MVYLTIILLAVVIALHKYIYDSYQTHVKFELGRPGPAIWEPDFDEKAYSAYMGNLAPKIPYIIYLKLTGRWKED